MPGLRCADRVVAISNYVRSYVQKHLRDPDERLRMIYNGVKLISSQERRQKDVNRYAFCVGSLPPHKNLARMIDVFASQKRISRF